MKEVYREEERSISGYWVWNSLTLNVKSED